MSVGASIFVSIDSAEFTPICTAIVIAYDTTNRSTVTVSFGTAHVSSF
jgi:hypothetical protein